MLTRQSWRPELTQWQSTCVSAQKVALECEESALLLSPWNWRMSGIDFRNLFFLVIFLTLHSPSLCFHSHQTQSRLLRPPDVARTSCSIPRNGLQTTSGRNS